ncbi:hypothetical protein LRP67_16335 [Nocardioides sp. cx-169]|uniref:hypothetical protein n=1 Tax=Nocardioides sp. cx-169 TaxID=2899080 RepID=UPI001E2A215F|nr:hypothetical protein [Nocardioides sp. cx-169]MCD4535662.1 hypothetical protein [Nocardioides sp. cx-169]
MSGATFAALAEEIVRDRMRHYGYTEERLAAAENIDHQDEGCTYEGFVGWTCVDEDDQPIHPDRDELERAAEFVVWIFEHPTAARALAALTDPETETDRSEDA